jgi:hypothetical protein
MQKIRMRATFSVYVQQKNNIVLLQNIFVWHKVSIVIDVHYSKNNDIINYNNISYFIKYASSGEGKIIKM